LLQRYSGPPTQHFLGARNIGEAVSYIPGSVFSGYFRLQLGRSKDSTRLLRNLLYGDGLPGGNIQRLAICIRRFQRQATC
jgi:hypothetical protein